MYEIWKQFNQIWLYLSLIQDILCVCLRRYFLYVIRTCSRQWLKSFLSFTNKEQLPQTIVQFLCSFIQGECCIWASGGAVALFDLTIQPLYIIIFIYFAHNSVPFVRLFSRFIEYSFPYLSGHKLKCWFNQDF